MAETIENRIKTLKTGAKIDEKEELQLELLNNIYLQLARLSVHG